MSSADNETKAEVQPINEAAANAPAKAMAKVPAARAVRRHAKRALVAGTLVLCLVALATGMRVTYSAFMAGDYLKGVVVTNDTQSLFASDLLYSYTQDPEENPAEQLLAVDPDASGNCSFTFSVYNCLPADQNVVNMKDVTYTLSVVLHNWSGDNWTISRSEGVPEVGQPSTFLGGRAKIDTYTITFPKQALTENAYFTVKAAVDVRNSPGTTLNCLAAKIIPNERVVVQSASVEGAFVDKDAKDMDSNVIPFSKYDAYNYRITVTAQEAQVELSWDPTKVDLDYFFNTRFSAVVDKRAGKATLTLQPGGTVVNFYRHGDVVPSDWSELGISVKKVD